MFSIVDKLERLWMCKENKKSQQKISIEEARDKETESQFKMEKQEKGYIIKKFIGAQKEVTIPSTYKGEKVIKIASSAFSYEIIESVNIPSSIEVIGAYAFSGCSKLTKITLSEGLKCIERYAFHSTATGTVTIPKSVETIQSEAFGNCKRTINCRTESKPAGWDDDWKGHLSVEVVWGYRD